MPASKRHAVRPQTLCKSRKMRSPQTPPEALLWKRLRDRRIGFKFRRQHPVGRFIVDFYCAEAILAVEVDGDIHAQAGREARDAARSRWLASRGIRVIRFTARDVKGNLDGVLERIREECAARRESKR